MAGNGAGQQKKQQIFFRLTAFAGRRWRLVFISKRIVSRKFYLCFFNMSTVITQNTKYTKIAYYIIWSLFTISFFYITIINTTKRLYDIIGTKDKAIFYTIIIYIIHFTVPLIPFLKYTSIIFALIINAVLLFKQGKYICPTKKEKPNEEV